MSAAAQESEAQSARHVLTDYQFETVEALQAVARRAIAQQVREPEKRGEIARHGGVMLLQSPTASGKTLMLGRTLEGLVGKLERKTVWFWFAPFSGLVDQTVEALSEQCPGLRLRDATRDREPGLARDGDVFINTWSAVAANNKDARKVRRVTEDTYSLDQMLELLRLDGFSIGVVIDEAHLNFGTAAAAAADFYLNHLRPDVTILATATPRDEKLKEFAEKAGVDVGSRIIVSRDQVVERGLNKFGLMVGVMRLREEDQALVDPETSALSCGWHQHCAIKARLVERGLGVVPLMLVQVEDQKKGEDDPIERVKAKLIAIGVPEGRIATHTSGKPDPDFHTLAFDPTREVLIFKVSVATGFDAPRAWTLVSLRPSRGKDFGLQIVGRIMRVHPLVRPIHGQDDLLDRGYVFLTDAELQSGLQQAAAALEAVVSSIDVVTSHFDLVELGTAQPLAIGDAARFTAFRKLPPPPRDDDERQARLESLIEEQRVPGNIRERSDDEIDRAIQVAEHLKQVGNGDLFGGTLPNQDAPDLFETGSRSKQARSVNYPLRDGIDVPEALIAEMPPRAEILNSEAFNIDLARRFLEKSTVLQSINTRMGTGTLELSDLFDEERRFTIEDIQVRLDDARIEKEGQLAFDFDRSVNQRFFRRALKDALRRAAVNAGMAFTDLDLTRAIYLAAMREPKALKEALKAAKASYIETAEADPVPRTHPDYADCERSKLSAYGIIPSGLNGPETAFARWLDEDQTGKVKWWLRNPHRAGWSKGWSTNLILPSGGFFFPDFVVSVKGRSTPNEIVLVEIKGTHNDNTVESLEKIGVRHRKYDAVQWAQKDEDIFLRLGYDEIANRLLPRGRFDIDGLLRTTG
tara:strand:+ start:2159 stop:4750 length:2592 start_codon:yes stop_codon:yes gene_type:complete